MTSPYEQIDDFCKQLASDPKLMGNTSKTEYRILNPLQELMAFSDHPPLLCHRKLPLCAGCAPGQTFQCSSCLRLVPWCMGAADAYEDLCDRCAVEAMNQIEKKEGNNGGVD